MKSYELLREGEPTINGMLILPGATTISDKPLPILSEDGSRVIGAVRNLRREGNSIFGDVELDVDCVTVQGVGDIDEDNTVTEFSITTTHVSPKSSFPWRDKE